MLHLAKEFKEKTLDSGDHTGEERDYSVCTDPKCLWPFPKALDHETMLFPHCHKQAQAHLSSRGPSSQLHIFLLRSDALPPSAPNIKACLPWVFLSLNKTKQKKKRKINSWARSSERMTMPLINQIHVPSQGEVTIYFSFQFNQSKRVSFSLSILAKKETCPSLAPSCLHQQIDLIVSKEL